MLKITYDKKKGKNTFLNKRKHIILRLSAGNEQLLSVIDLTVQNLELLFLLS